MAAPYGRYGFSQWPAVDGFDLQPDGFRVTYPAGDKVSFYSGMKEVVPKRVNWQDALYQGRDLAYTPGAVRVYGFETGFRLYFPLGFMFKFSTNLSPFLTWGEGTVEKDIPTAPSTWILLSFRENQAPILLTFESPVQLQIDGDSGDWSLKTVGRYKGWVRVMLPFGPTKMGPTVMALGSAVEKLKPILPYVSKMAPELVGFEQKEDDSGITGIWRFAGTGAMVPKQVALAKAGGYACRVLTGTSIAGIDLFEGPAYWSLEPRVAVRFPSRRVPVGRALMMGETAATELATVSAFDAGGVVELALANLSAGRDMVTAEAMTLVQEEYAASLKLVQDPVSQGWSTSGAEGQGLDVAAAQSVLEEAGLTSRGPSVTENRGFGRLADRLDWSSWQVWCPDKVVSARATGFLALAGGISQEPRRRLIGCLAEAGSAARVALLKYRERRKYDFETGLGAMPDPLLVVRKTLYADGDQQVVRDKFAEGLMSPVRVIGPYRVTAVPAQKGYLMSWLHQGESPKVMTLLTGYPVQIEAKANLSGIKPMGGLGMTQLVFEPEKPDICSVILRLPEYAPKLPEAVAAPRYSE